MSRVCIAPRGLHVQNIVAVSSCTRVCVCVCAEYLSIRHTTIDMDMNWCFAARLRFRAKDHTAVFIRSRRYKFQRQSPKETHGILTYPRIHNTVYVHNQRFIMALKHPLVDTIYSHCVWRYTCKTVTSTSYQHARVTMLMFISRMHATHAGLQTINTSLRSPTDDHSAVFFRR